MGFPEKEEEQKQTATTKTTTSVVCRKSYAQRIQAFLDRYPEIAALPRIQGGCAGIKIRFSSCGPPRSLQTREALRPTRCRDGADWNLTKSGQRKAQYPQLTIKCPAVYDVQGLWVFV